MTDIRTRGLSGSELAILLADTEDDHALEAAEDVVQEADIEATRREIAWLRKEVRDLQDHLAVRAATESETPLRKNRPWLRIAAAVAVTFSFGGLVRQFRLGGKHRR